MVDTKKVAFNLHLPSEMAMALSEMAGENHRSRSEMIREILRGAVGKWQEERKPGARDERLYAELMEQERARIEAAPGWVGPATVDQPETINQDEILAAMRPEVRALVEIELQNRPPSHGPVNQKAQARWLKQREEEAEQKLFDEAQKQEDEEELRSDGLCDECYLRSHWRCVNTACRCECKQKPHMRVKPASGPPWLASK